MRCDMRRCGEDSSANDQESRKSSKESLSERPCDTEKQKGKGGGSMKALSGGRRLGNLFRQIRANRLSVVWPRSGPTLSPMFQLCEGAAWSNIVLQGVAHNVRFALIGVAEMEGARRHPRLHSTADKGVLKSHAGV